MKTETSIHEDLQDLKACATRVVAKLRKLELQRSHATRMIADPVKHSGRGDKRSVQEKAWKLYLDTLHLRLWEELPKYGLTRSQISKLIGRHKTTVGNQMSWYRQHQERLKQAKETIQHAREREVSDSDLGKISFVAFIAMNETSIEAIRTRVAAVVSKDELKTLAMTASNLASLHDCKEDVTG